MVVYGRISSKVCNFIAASAGSFIQDNLEYVVNGTRLTGDQVWTSVAGFENINNEVRKDEIGYLDYQIQEWQSSIPDSLRFHLSDNSLDSGMNRTLRRLRVLLYLRSNQLRIQLYRPVLYSITSIMENRGYAQTVVEVAKDNIQVLTGLNQTSDIYRGQQAVFSYFLISALALLFLAVSHAPMQFSEQVRDEFYMALELVKGCSSRSFISRRLWKTIKGLKEAQPKLGLMTGTGMADANDPHSSAAVAMAGLAGHQVDEIALFSQGQPINSLSSSPMDGQQMSYELTNLFEAAGNYGAMMLSRQDGLIMNGMVGSHGDLGQGLEPFSLINGNEEEFVKIMKECF